MKEDIKLRQAPVSVVVPCYRCRETVERAVKSIAAQTLAPAEVILVDDGSPDGTLEVLEALARRHAAGWMKVIALPRNQGAASARTIGWSAATQPYVAFLDSDDTWDARKIEVQYGYMAANPGVAMSGHGHVRLCEDAPPLAEPPELYARTVSKLELLLSNRFFAPTMIMVRRDVPYRFLPGRRHVDDHLLWLQIVCAGMRFTRLSAKLAYTYKAPFGESGLSAQLWKMEKAELENYWILRRDGWIGTATAAAISAYSLLKFLRRLLLVGLRNLRRR